MKDTLKRKNIESFFVDILIIIGTYFIVEIEIPTIVFIVLLFLSFVILIITKRPPKNFFLVVIYVLSVIVPIFGFVLLAETLSIDINKDIESFSLISWAVLSFSAITFILIIVSFSKKNKIYYFGQTFLLPIFFTIVVLSVSYICGRYSTGPGIVVALYIPLRFLMAFKEPIKWYQFILLITAIVIVFIPFYSDNKEYPIKPVKEGLAGIYANFAYTVFEDYENDKVIEVTVKKRSYQTKLEEGDYYILVTNIWNNKWRIDKNKTIQYYKEKGSYYKDSADLHMFLSEIRPPKNYRINSIAADDFERANKRKKASKYCDSAEYKIKNVEFEKAFHLLNTAQNIDSVYNRIYYLKAVVLIENKGITDSICYNLGKAVGYYNSDAIPLYRKYCLVNNK